MPFHSPHSGDRKKRFSFFILQICQRKKNHCKNDTSTFSLILVLQSVTSGPISHFRCIKQQFNLSLPVRKHCTSSGDFFGICCKAYSTVREKRPSPPNTLWMFFLYSWYLSHESFSLRKLLDVQGPNQREWNKAGVGHGYMWEKPLCSEQLWRRRKGKNLY